ncbi:MAG: hypothetical protein LBB94_00460 [Clostridiales bacterium]|nr:hypothetical protein [Clostridiales bacterium]
MNLKAIGIILLITVLETGSNTQNNNLEHTRNIHPQTNLTISHDKDKDKGRELTDDTIQAFSYLVKPNKNIIITNSSVKENKDKKQNFIKSIINMVKTILKQK